MNNERRMWDGHYARVEARRLAMAEEWEAIVPHFCWDEDCTAIVDAPRNQERVYCCEHSVLKDQF